MYLFIRQVLLETMNPERSQKQVLSPRLQLATKTVHRTRMIKNVKIQYLLLKARLSLYCEKKTHWQINSAACNIHREST